MQKRYRVTVTFQWAILNTDVVTGDAEEAKEFALEALRNDPLYTEGMFGMLEDVRAVAWHPSQMAHEEVPW